MSKFEQRAVGSGQWVVRGKGRRVFGCLLSAVFCLLSFAGCRMDMQDQPRYEAYEKGSTRQPIDGTVARGQLREDKHFYTGKKDGAAVGAQGQAGQANNGNANAQTDAAAMYPDAVDTFPFPVTEEIVRRGQNRYQIFCAMCHGETGAGDGMIVRRGFRRPPAYSTEALRSAPVGHFYDVITNGWGSMPSYSSQITPADRWAIVAYIRALQRSQIPQATASPTPAAATTTQTPQGNSNGGQR